MFEHLTAWDWAEIVGIIMRMAINLSATCWTIYTIWKVGVQGYELKFIKPAQMGEKEEHP